MENLQTVTLQIPNVESVARRRSLIPGLFGLTIFFFFFTFCEFSCQGRKIASMSGFDLVTGSQIEQPQTPTLFGPASDAEKQTKKVPSSMWAILAFLAAAAGLGAFMARHKMETLIGTGAGAVGALALLLLQTTFSAAVKKETNGMMEVDFQFAFWGAFLALGAAGVLSFLRLRQSAARPAVA